MDKYWNGRYSDKKYALKQLKELNRELMSLADQIAIKDEEIGKIRCGLTTGHKWQLHKFCDTTYPLAKPPGVYWYKCSNCGEIIILKACDKRVWKKSLDLGESR